MHIFEAFLNRSNVVILDGALATEIERQGEDLRHKLWSAKLLIENPSLIKAVHKEYLISGADVITTCSYQATFQGFQELSIGKEEAKKLLLDSSKIAIEARHELIAENKLRDPFPLIASSIGPYGAYLANGSEYRGDYGKTVDELISFHRERLECLMKSNVDLFACETIPCSEEAKAFIKLLSEYPDSNAWITFTCKDESHISSGELFERCVSLANASQQVIAVGVNCSNPAFVDSLIKIAKRVTDKLIVVYPNKGETWDSMNHRWMPGTESVNLVDAAVLWHKSGARLIGGCCRTSPADIAALCAKLKHLQ
ncbi:homocysteine S-methyltransferase-like protein [Leptotrombidium deliense]|uniref:Homocysteine S-methyltransferase-like protein n=1 Tax=Leptotrombidium deliense TaxID=299467 RepID=A0A443SSJ2_9ACAR|nr:homocysteine S-methyltransferase-like protein [Leptotrombidium deliense]